MTRLEQLAHEWFLNEFPRGGSYSRGRFVRAFLAGANAALKEAAWKCHVEGCCDCEKDVLDIAKQELLPLDASAPKGS